MEKIRVKLYKFEFVSFLTLFKLGIFFTFVIGTVPYILK